MTSIGKKRSFPSGWRDRACISSMLSQGQSALADLICAVSQ